MPKVKMLTVFVILVFGLLPVSPATAFDAIIGHLWIEFGGPIGVPPVVLQFSTSAPLKNVPPAECSPGANYSDCATALKLGTMLFSIPDVGEGTMIALRDDDGSLNPGNPTLVPLVLATQPAASDDDDDEDDETSWVVGSSWAVLFASPTN